MRRKIHWFFVIAACAAIAVGGAACGDDDDDDATPVATATVAAATSPTASAEGTVVEVLLNEFAVVPDRESVPAGSVTFRAKNEGPDDPHELVIIRTDLAPDALPTDADGSVNEDGLDVIDEIEEFPVGETDAITVELDAGAYVLICNVVLEEDEGIESHYAKGMRRAFTVAE